MMKNRTVYQSNRTTGGSPFWMKQNEHLGKRNIQVYKRDSIGRCVLNFEYVQCTAA